MKNSDTVKELIYQIADGNPDAFGKFYDCFFHKVYQFTGYFIKSDKVCEEIVSDVFLTLWITREKLIEIENIEAFIYTITKNKSSFASDKLKGIEVITGEGIKFTPSEDGLSISSNKQKFTAIPYYIWNNRGINVMKVWIPNKISDLLLAKE